MKFKRRFGAPVLVAERLHIWLIELRTRDYTKVLRATRSVKASRTLDQYTSSCTEESASRALLLTVLLLVLKICVQGFVADQYFVLYRRSRVQTWPPEIAFHPSSSSSRCCVSTVVITISFIYTKAVQRCIWRRRWSS